MIPSFLGLTLLSLAAYRTWKLIGEDTILDRPRNWAVKRGGEYVKLFLECPWCAGFWVSLAWWGLWQLWPHAVLVAAGVMAISAIVGILGYFT